MTTPTKLKPSKVHWWLGLRKWQQILAALVLTAGSTIAAIINGPVTPDNSQYPATPAPSAPTPLSRTLSPCQKKLRITSPQNNQQVGLNGVLIKGVSCGMNNEHGWVFVFDTITKSYYDYSYTDAPDPIIARNGAWRFRIRDIGNPGDKDRLYPIKLVEASPACNSELLHSPRIIPNNDFPSDCSIDDTVDVLVTR
jgi:hypothetical protein